MSAEHVRRSLSAALLDLDSVQSSLAGVFDEHAPGDAPLRESIGKLLGSVRDLRTSIEAVDTFVCARAPLGAAGDHVHLQVAGRPPGAPAQPCVGSGPHGWRYDSGADVWRCQRCPATAPAVPAGGD